MITLIPVERTLTAAARALCVRRKQKVMMPQPPKSAANDKPRALLVILKHLGCYLLGILACVLLTPVDFVLAGKALWPLYALLAVLGFFVYFTLSPT